MALIVDYGSLQTAIADWIWRVGDPNVVANIPQMIVNFESEFKRAAKVLEMQVGPLTGTLASPLLPIPADFLELVRLQLTGLPSGTPNQPLSFVSPARGAFLDATTTASGTPQWYTIIGTNFVISPQPWVPVGATYELTYFGFTPLNLAVGGVNNILLKHPDLYLYGSLMQAAAYIDDKETVAQWATALDRGMSSLLEGDKKKKAGGPLVMLPSMAFVSSRRRTLTPNGA
jgi:hypothetical protein